MHHCLPLFLMIEFSQVEIVLCTSVVLPEKQLKPFWKRLAAQEFNLLDCLSSTDKGTREASKSTELARLSRRSPF